MQVSAELPVRPMALIEARAEAIVEIFGPNAVVFRYTLGPKYSCDHCGITVIALGRLEGIWIAALGEWRWGIRSTEFACERSVATIWESGRCIAHRSSGCQPAFSG